MIGTSLREGGDWMNKKISLFGLALAATMVFAVVCPVFAKNFNVPGVIDVAYLEGGTAVIETPEGFLFAKLSVTAVVVESAIVGHTTSLHFLMPFELAASGWLPIASFTTNPEAIPGIIMLWSGLPAAFNVKLLQENEIEVNRHGNSISVASTSPQTIMLPGGPVTIPAFAMELNKVGGSIHTEIKRPLTSYADASNIILTQENVGFNAIGAFTCATWNYVQEPMTDAMITMHGVETWTPIPMP
jgi:hypothetical protein